LRAPCVRKSLAILNSYRDKLRNYIGEEPNKCKHCSHCSKSFTHFSGQVFCRYIQDFTLERSLLLPCSLSCLPI